ncbi:MAG: hypothetical protein HZA59_09305 [Hydrogenophilales bacterium]|nr:hypothetical protein [Hydrogenophilales bacterium]
MPLGTTLTQFLIEEQRHVQGATGDFTGLLNDVVTACKMIANGVNHGDLLGVLGAAGSENVQGEEQKKMDILSNEIFLKRNEWAGHLAAMASEEMDEIYQIPAGNPRGKDFNMRWVASMVAEVHRIHQRVPVILGSKHEVDVLVSYHQYPQSKAA